MGKITLGDYTFSPLLSLKIIISTLVNVFLALVIWQNFCNERETCSMKFISAVREVNPDKITGTTAKLI